MGCASCSSGKDGVPNGCQSKGSCLNGGCNKRNTFDWLSKLDLTDYDNYEYVEVSFRNGSRKAFFKNKKETRAITGDIVMVEAETGYDIGSISLSGELVRMQMKKKRVNEDNVLKSVIRRANTRDIEKMAEARSQEQKTMIRSRKIARDLSLDMKIGDVEYQADKRKATFFYTAEGRVDFRELIRHFAKEFRVKIEMRQIGARQESAQIGGIGSCGRELCCSTWLTDFKTVSTTAARYQNLAINQAKLSGQCGRLKCCLNYELDTYMEALEAFPDKADTLYTVKGKARLVKTDIFKGLMYYVYITDSGRSQFYPLKLKRVKEILKLNAKNEKPDGLEDYKSFENQEVEIDFESVNEVIELPMEKRKKKKRRPNKNRKKGKPRGNDNRDGNSNRKPKPKGNKNSSENRNENKGNPKSKGNSKNKGTNKNGGNSNQPKRKPQDGKKPQDSSKPQNSNKPKGGNNEQGGDQKPKPKKKRWFNKKKKD